MVYNDPNNTNSVVYQHTLLSYQLKTSHWNFSWAATLHLCNMADRGEKLQQPHCYHPFSDSRDTYLTKNYYENYSPKMVPTNPTGSWTSLSPGRRQIIIGTNAGILMIGPIGTTFSEILIAINIFSFKKMHLKLLSAIHYWTPDMLLHLRDTQPRHLYAKGKTKYHLEN